MLKWRIHKIFFNTICVFSNEIPMCDLTSFKHKSRWIHNNKLNNDSRICYYLKLIEPLYSWRRKLVVVDFLFIIKSPLTTVGSSFWLCPSYHYAEIWSCRFTFKFQKLICSKSAYRLLVTLMPVTIPFSCQIS